jgi:molybdenum cofactor cytidylyltransferase
VIGAIVLAAGASSRMGRPKAWLTLGPGGLAFVDAIRSTLFAAGVSEIRVVASPGLTPPIAGAVINPDPSAGMLSSLHCGLRAFRDGLEAVLVWPVDHPVVKPDTLLAMLAALRRHRAPVIVPTYQGRRGHPVLFASAVFPELLAADPSRGARAVVHAHEERIELPVPDPGVVLDVDTPERYARLLEELGPSPSELV